MVASLSPQTKSAMRSINQLLGRNSPLPMCSTTQLIRSEKGAINWKTVIIMIKIDVMMMVVVLMCSTTQLIRSEKGAINWKIMSRKILLGMIAMFMCLVQ